MKPTSKDELDAKLRMAEGELEARLRIAKDPEPSIGPAYAHNAVLSVVQMYGAMVQALQMKIDRLENKNMELSRDLMSLKIKHNVEESDD